jgi:hypothetical protein
MIEREMLIPLADLKRVELRCSEAACAGSLTLDLSDTSLQSARCPMCEKQLVEKGIVYFAEAWRAFLAKAGNTQIYFRVEGVPNR